MGQLFSRINNFLNDEQTIEVLYFLVLFMALLWLLSGGFRFLHKKTKRKKIQKQKQKKEEQ
jgi:hypothetical protein